MKTFVAALLVIAILAGAVFETIGFYGLYRDFKKKSEVPTYTVKFESNGGTGIESQTVKAGGFVTAPPTPEREGYVFIGWYTNAECDEAFVFESTAVNADITLYADWLSGDEDSIMAYLIAHELSIVYQQGDNRNHVTRDVILPTTVEGFDNFTAVWSSSAGAIDTTGRVTRPSGEDASVKLTVTVTVNGMSANLEHNLRVVHINDRNPDEIENSSVVDIQNMNEGREYDISFNENKNRVTSIEGTYSDIIVENADDALDVVQSIHTIIGVNNPYEELEVASVSYDEYGAEYTFSQSYTEYEVYARRLTVSVNEQGITDFFGSGTYPTSLLENVDFGVVLPKEAAEAIAVEHFGGECVADTEKTAYSIYTFDEYEEYPVLTYKILVSGYDKDGVYIISTVFVNVKSGEIVYINNEMMTETATTGSGQNELNNMVSFPVTYISGNQRFFYMKDLDRNIQIYEQFSGDDWCIGSAYNAWFDKTAVSAYTNAITTFDWFKTVLGINSLDGNGFKVNVVVHSDISVNNAFWNSSEKILLFCDNSSDLPIKETTAAALDVVAHEYTHGIVQFVTGELPYENATGAINEGYADIFGCLIEGDWQIGEDWITLRDASNPTAYKCPDKMSSPYFHDYTVSDDDNGGVHINSSLIYYAAYLMSEAGFDNNKLAKLWYKSLQMGYDGGSDFSSVRKNVIKAARKMYMSERDIMIIKLAFDKVEIFGDRGTLEGGVNTTSGSAMPNSTVNIYYRGILTQTLTADSNGRFSVVLEEGDYTVEIVSDGYVNFISGVTVTENETTRVDAILVKEGVGFVSGTVVSATSALTLSNVELNVRAGLNTKTGAVIKTGKTNSSGRYSFELDAGYYTIEMIYDEYTTGYVNVMVTAGSEVVANGSLSPIMASSTYRVVLTWGAYPTDLDSHLEGYAEDGSSYHIYYRSKNAYDRNGNLIANLDVDDTTSYGPETTTFGVDTEGTYKYYIHRYSSGSLPSSGAVIEVYNGYNLIARYNIDPSAYSNSIYWDVFKIENGIFQTLDNYR